MALTRGGASRRRARATRLDRWGVLALLAVFVVSAFAAAATGAGRGLERQLQDIRDAVRARPASGSVVLVEIDAKSISEIARWPWPRSIYAGALDQASAAHAALLAFDVDFSSPSTPSEDHAFAEALGRARVPVALATFLQAKTQGGAALVENLPLPLFRTKAALASVNVAADPDGLVRSYPFGVVTGGVARPSISALLASASGRSGRAFAIDGAIWPESVPRVSFIDLIRGRAPKAALAGRNLIVGATALELGDRYPVPRHGVLPGALIQALAAETLIQKTSPTDRGPILPVLLVFGALALVLTRPALRGWRLWGALATLLIALLALPLASETLRLGSPEVAPAVLGLLAASGLLAALTAAHSIQRARLHDAATGLANQNRLAEMLETAGGPSLVVAVSLRGFNDVMAVMGAAGATGLISRLAERLVVLAEGPVFRVEDDVLGWLQPSLSDEDLEAMVTGAASALSQPVEVAGRFIELEWSLGVAEAQAGDSAGVAHALLAAKGAADKGRRWARYDQRLDQESDWRLRLRAELDRAMESGEIWVAYQPKLDIARDRIVSAEALVRWSHPERGNIPPDAFIPLLEESGRIGDLTLFVLEEVLGDMAAWRGEGLTLGVAINLSAPLAADAAFLATLKARLQRSADLAAALTFEVTESASLEDFERAVLALGELIELGARISIDDYGAGQSTLTYLSLTTSRSDQAMVRSSIELAHELGLKVVAEGVETAAALRMLKSFGCDVAQGWHIGRPARAAVMRDLALEGRAGALEREPASVP